MNQTDSPETPTNSLALGHGGGAHFVSYEVIPRLPVELKLLDNRHQTVWQLPGYATSKSAGIDLRAAIATDSLTIQPNQTILIPTGIAINIKHSGYAGFIYPRSGLGHKHGLILGNGVGVIDADYQGEVMVSLWNRSETPYTIQVGDRIAQLVIAPVFQASFRLVDDFEKSDRADGGFGHTGVR